MKMLKLAICSYFLDIVLKSRQMEEDFDPHSSF